MEKVLGLRKKVWVIIAFLACFVLVITVLYRPKGEDIEADTMAEIQENLQDQIYQILRKRSGEITNIKFEKFWTEQVNPHTVKANFVISYDEPLSEDTGKVLREGSMILTKLDDTPEEQVWIADAVNVNGEQITFENGLKFKAGEDEEAVDDEVPASELLDDSYVDGESEDIQFEE